MTPERIEQERKAFEEWMAELYPTNPQTERVGDEYSRLGTQYKWEGWQAKAAQSGWISVEDRLPPLDEEVIVSACGIVFNTWRHLATYKDSDGVEYKKQEWYLGYEYDEDDCPITHWQPIPPPTQEW